MTAESKLLLGQLLAVGFDGPVIPAEYEKLIREYKVGNVLLFRRNVHSYEQLKALCGALNALIEKETGHPPIIMIGEEGGSVSRVAHIAAQTPCPMAVGATGETKNAYTVGRIAGEQLRAVGINMGLGPVLDCYSNPDNTVIGNRSFGSDPRQVAAFGLAYIRGMRETGVLPCAKHFPGHGDTATDSHLALPVIEKTETALWETELPPFAAAIEKGVEAIMTAHVVLPAVDPERVPSTVSKRVMTGLLRKKMGFQGLLLSDGMEMNAVMNLYGIEEATRRAIEAGCDIALICHSAGQAASTMEYLGAALEEGRLQMDDVRDRYSRVTALKERLPALEGDKAQFGSDAQKNAAKRIMRQSLRLLNAPEGMALPRLGKRTLFLGLPARAASIAGDAAPINAALRFSERFGGRYFSGLPEDGETEDALNAVAFLSPHEDMDRIVRAADTLAERGLPVIAVSLSTPRCLDALPNIMWKAAAWEYDDLSVNTLLEAFV